MRVKSLFYKKIKCGLCGANFKSKRDRCIMKYLCSNYENYGKCERILIHEDRLVKLVNKRYQKELTKEEIREVVVEVIIRSERLFDIHLTEGRPISFHERGIVF